MASEKQATVADVVADMRSEGHTGDSSCLEWVGAKMRDYADRIEAAWKRERDRLIYAFDPTKCEKSKAPDPSAYAIEGLRAGHEHHPVGGVAAWREVLARIVETAKAWAEPGADAAITLGLIIDRAESALAKPARNVENYKSQDDAWFAYKTERGGTVYFDLPSYVAFVDWLFAISGKGGAK